MYTLNCIPENNPLARLPSLSAVMMAMSAYHLVTWCGNTAKLFRAQQLLLPWRHISRRDSLKRGLVIRFRGSPNAFGSTTSTPVTQLHQILDAGNAGNRGPSRTRLDEAHASALQVPGQDWIEHYIWSEATRKGLFVQKTLRKAKGIQHAFRFRVRSKIERKHETITEVRHNNFAPSIPCLLATKISTNLFDLGITSL